MSRVSQVQRGPSASPNITFGSLFSGCGGFDLGFLGLGHQCLFAFDNDEHAVANYSRNIDRVVRQRDLRLPLPHGLPTPDIVVSGPPCQGFSLAGKRTHDDPRNHLLLEAARHSVRLAPRIVLIENVRGVLSGSHRQYWDKSMNLLRRHGYSVRQYDVDACRHGIPQKRRRVVLFASRIGTPPALDPVPCPTLAETLAGVEQLPNHDPQILDPTSAHWAIANRVRQGQKLSNVRGGSASVHTWEIPEAFGRVTADERLVLETMISLRRRLRVRSDGDADPVPAETLSSLFEYSLIESLLSKGYLRSVDGGIDLTHTFNGKYRRLTLSGLAPTVDTRYGDFRYFLHPVENRGLSVREAARIQGFPDWYSFSGPTSVQYRLIGNAVPPTMAASLAAACERLLREKGESCLAS